MPDDFLGSRIGETLEESNKRYAEQFGSKSNTPSSEAKNSIDGSCICEPKPDVSDKLLSSKTSTKIAHGSLDKRISLTVAPKTFSRDEGLFVEKVKYVLGSKELTSKDSGGWLFSGSKFYGLLRNALGTTSGLIFPYTPSVSFSHKVNYESSEIIDSNISYNYYKNTPCPTVKLNNIKFTADNRKNALHMISAIWFLTACTKCEFGEADPLPNNAIHAEKGLPPPVLYLNGYNSTIDNIPVVINAVSYDYPADVHYVNLILDMSKPSTNDDFCKIYDTPITNTYSEKRIDHNVVTSDMGPTKPRDVTSIYNVTEVKNGINLSFWLPTELSINVDLLIQPNFLKVRKQWNLDRYKMGLMMTEKWKNPPMTYGTKQITEKCGEVPKDTFLSSIPTGWTW